MRRWLFLGVFLIAVFALTPWAVAGADHELYVRLDPDRQLLTGADEVALTGKTAASIVFFLSPKAEILRLTVDGVPAEYRVFRGRVAVAPPAKGPENPVRLRVEYEAVFDDPVPTAPANTDNPGYGVSGTISEKGTFILGGAGWYPMFHTEDARFSITVDAPEGISAVTAGRPAGRSTRNGRTLSRWEVDRAADRLALSAGGYIVTEDDADGIRVATYFSDQTQPLAGRYIEAVKGYLRLYTALFGPYPFEKFAVVENFFPTGYGFPSYTLMGGVVLRLPFIIDVSLGHEVAHCWWGNGVRVDAAAGNWSEGLTTYVADYLFKERESKAAAEEYRRQWLRNYAALVDENNDFPLSEFVGRTDRVTKVVGYDKSAMVFHMLRQILGEEVFWGGLRDLYEKMRFERATWEDFRTAFEQRAGLGPCCTLEDFFSQWIHGTGAPVLALQDVARQRDAGGWRVSGKVVQLQTGVFDLTVTLAVKTDADTRYESISLHQKEAAFSIHTESAPVGVELDPGADLFRRLHPEEVPPSVNAIKGADSVAVILAEGAGREGLSTAKMLVDSLGLSAVRIVGEAESASVAAVGGSRVYIGFPAEASFISGRRPVALFADRFSAGERRFDAPTDTFFGVFADPGGDGVVGILYPVHPRFGPLVARKVTHYGKYSYLAFERGRNAVKGVWPVVESPLIFQWP